MKYRQHWGKKKDKSSTLWMTLNLCSRWAEIFAIDIHHRMRKSIHSGLITKQLCLCSGVWQLEKLWFHVQNMFWAKEVCISVLAGLERGNWAGALVWHPHPQQCCSWTTKLPRPLTFTGFGILLRILARWINIYFKRPVEGNLFEVFSRYVFLVFLYLYQNNICSTPSLFDALASVHCSCRNVISVASGVVF